MFIAVDDLSRKVWVFLLKNRSGAGVAECLKRLFIEAGRPEEVTAVIRSDNAKEFKEGRVPELLSELGSEWLAPEGAPPPAGTLLTPGLESWACLAGVSANR